MKKLFTLGSLLLLGFIPWMGAMAENLTTLNAEASGKVFTIKTERGYWYADGTQNRIAASKGDFETAPYSNIDFPNSDVMSKFTFVKATNQDAYFLYNIDNSKWVKMNGTRLDLSATVDGASEVALAATTGGRAETYPHCIYFGGNQANMYGVSPGWTPDVTKWNDTGDQGNNSLFTIVEPNVSAETLASLTSQVDAVTNRIYSVSSRVAGKKFTIGGTRGYWKADPSNSYVTSTTNKAEATNFAIINHGERYFLYDADHNKWVTPVSGTPGTGTGLALSASPTLAEVGLINSTNSEADTYPSVVTFFYGSRQYGISTGYTPSVISYNDLSDAGNAAALALTGTSVENLDSLRTAIANSYVTPFVVSTGNDPSKWVWYHLTLRGNKYVHVEGNNARPVVSTEFANTDEYKWAFVAGDNRGFTPFSFKIYNKKLGTAKTMKGDAQMASASSGNDNLIISMGGQDGSGFNFRTGVASSNTNYIHDLSGNLNTWNTSAARTDNGSTFRVQLAEGLVTFQNLLAIENNAYGYMGATEAGLVGGAQSVGLQNVVYVNATEAGKVSLQFEGKYAQTVSESTQVGLGESPVAFTTGRATFFPYQITLGTGGNRAFLHEAGSQSHKVVGWETGARATNWQVAPAQDIQMTANAVGDKFYATLHAPFALQLTGATAYTAKVNLAKNTLELTAVEGNTVPANTGVVVVSDAATYSVTPVQSVAKALDTDLVGVNADTAWDRNNLSLGRNNGVAGFYKWSGTTLAANKAYLPASKLSESGARGLAFDFGGTTAIQGVETQNGKTGKVFNLQGQQVGDSYRGIVIVNGKKVIK